MSEEFMKSHFESNYSNIGHKSPQFKVIMLCEKKRLPEKTGHWRFRSFYYRDALLPLLLLNVLVVNKLEPFKELVCNYMHNYTQATTLG